MTAQGWAILDMKTNLILYGKAENVKREIASLTKIMTFYSAISIIEKFEIDSKKVFFCVSKNASLITGTTARLQKGMWISLKDLFYALMLPSGNDAALVLSENLASFLKMA